MVEHELKIWPIYFQPILDGIKTFELRKADRAFRVGDILYLREFWQGQYTGRTLRVTVSYVLDGAMAIPGWTLMSIKVQGVP